jgi:hypothetical protein
MRELGAGPRQGGAGRRWFGGSGADLYVWQDAGGGIVAFELCYGKPRNERALRWRVGAGFDHVRIDDGEPGPHVNSTPIAVADGQADLEALALELEALAAGIEPRIYRFVLGRLRLAH